MKNDRLPRFTFDTTCRAWWSEVIWSYVLYILFRKRSAALTTPIVSSFLNEILLYFFVRNRDMKWIGLPLICFFCSKRAPNPFSLTSKITQFETKGLKLISSSRKRVSRSVGVVDAHPCIKICYRLREPNGGPGIRLPKSLLGCNVFTLGQCIKECLRRSVRLLPLFFVLASYWLPTNFRNSRKRSFKIGNVSW